MQRCWDGIKNKIKILNGDKENDYLKDYIKIKFDSDDDLPLNKLLKLSDLFLKKEVNFIHKFF